MGNRATFRAGGVLLLVALVPACGSAAGSGGPGGLSVRITRPDAPALVAPGAILEIELDDQGGAGAITTVVADRDGDLQTTADQFPVDQGPVGNRGVRSIAWDLTGVPLGTYRLFAVTSNASHAFATAEAPALVTVASMSFVETAGGVRSDRGRALEVLPDGGFFLGGYVHGAVTFDAGGANEQSFDAGGVASVVARYEPDGGLQWVRHWGGGNFIVGIWAIDSFPDGSCVATGTFVGSTVFGAGEANETTLEGDNGDVQFVRLNPDGTLAWARRATTVTPARGTDVVALADGSAIVAGAFAGSLTIGEGDANETVLQSASSEDAFLARLAPDGELMWVRHIGGFLFDSIDGVVQRADGSIVLTGNASGTLVLGDGEPNETTLSNRGPYVAAYDLDGNLLWAEPFGNGRVATHAIDAFPDGSLALAATFVGTVTLDPGGPREAEITSLGGTDWLVARLSATGRLAWHRVGGGAGSDSTDGIAVQPDGSLVVAGALVEDLTFAEGLPGEQTLLSRGEGDVALARFAGDGALRWAVRAGGVASDRAWSVAAGGPNGTLLVVGEFEAEADFGEGSAQPTSRTAPGTESEIFVARYHLDGGL